MQNVVGRPCCHGNDIWENLGYFSHKIAYKSPCMALRQNIFGPTRGPTLVATATTFGLGAKIYSPTGFSPWKLTAVDSCSIKIFVQQVKFSGSRKSELFGSVKQDFLNPELSFMFPNQQSQSTEGLAKFYAKLSQSQQSQSTEGLAELYAKLIFSRKYFAFFSNRFCC